MGINQGNSNEVKEAEAKLKKEQDEAEKAQKELEAALAKVKKHPLYVAEGRLKVDDKTYEHGDRVDLSKKMIETLLKKGCVVLKKG